jgi:hypothetical protein
MPLPIAVVRTALMSRSTNVTRSSPPSGQKVAQTRTRVGPDPVPVTNPGGTVRYVHVVPPASPVITSGGQNVRANSLASGTTVSGDAIKDGEADGASDGEAGDALGRG